MTTIAIRLSLAAALCAALSAWAPPSEARGTSARAEALEIEDKERASLSKETLKNRRLGRDEATAGGAAASQRCGNVDIGNSSESQRASSRIAERSKTVIVTGNVYNTARCR